MSETDTPQFGRAMTIDEWADLDEDQEGELVDGRLEEEEMPSLAHELIVSWLIGVLKAWAEPRGGVVVASGYKLALSARTGRVPDAVVWLPASPARPRDALKNRRPDVAVEVLSPRPRDARRDRVAKKREYAEFGLPSYWIIDSEARTLEVLTLGLDGRYIAALTESSGAVDIPGCTGLRLDLDDLWADVDRGIALVEGDDVTPRR